MDMGKFFPTPCLKVYMAYIFCKLILNEIFQEIKNASHTQVHLLTKTDYVFLYHYLEIQGTLENDLVPYSAITRYFFIDQSNTRNSFEAFLANHRLA